MRGWTPRLAGLAVLVLGLSLSGLPVARPARAGDEARLGDLTVPRAIVAGTSSIGRVSVVDDSVDADAPPGGERPTLVRVTLASSNPSAVRVPPSVTVAAGSTRTFPIETSAELAGSSAVISATLDGVTKRDTVEQLAPAVLGSLTFATETVVSGLTATGTIGLNGPPAPPYPALVSLSSSNPAVVAVPATVEIARGSKRANFTVNAGGVTQQTSVTVSASYRGRTETAVLKVRPPSLNALKLRPNNVTSGGTFSGTVELDGPAPAGGARVRLSRHYPLDSFPPPTSPPAYPSFPREVTIPVGQRGVTFLGNAGACSGAIAKTCVTEIHARYHGKTKKAKLTVRSPEPGL